MPSKVPRKPTEFLKESYLDSQKEKETAQAEKRSLDLQDSGRKPTELLSCTYVLLFMK